MDHYSIYSLDTDTVAELLAYFPNGKADPMNWLIASTSGVHGTYVTLDDIENDLHLPDDAEGSKHDTLTVIVIQPRRVSIAYGNVIVRTAQEIELLRELIADSLKYIAQSQMGNLSSE